VFLDLSAMWNSGGHGVAVLRDLRYMMQIRVNNEDGWLEDILDAEAVYTVQNRRPIVTVVQAYLSVHFASSTI
jgi:hypothetical protein